MNIWMVSREYDGLAGAGGVKDVCRQLAESLVRDGNCQVSVVIPRYGFMDPQAQGFSPLRFYEANERNGDQRQGVLGDQFEVDMNYIEAERREAVAVLHKRIRGVDIYLLESGRFREKLGVYTYTAEEEARQPWQQKGAGHYDYFAMNILLQKGALGLMILLDIRPDIIHCHDGHAATLAPMIRELEGYRHFFSNSGVAVTIHNAGLGYHQDVADLAFARVITGLPQRVIERALLDNSFDPFLAAADYAVLNTVSENYARELQETDEDARTGWLGHRLLSRGINLVGITNGIVPEDYDPQRADELGLAAPFSPLTGDLDGKRKCKEQMLKLVSSPETLDTVTIHGGLSLDARIPLLTLISRMSPQKGVDIMIGAVRQLLRKKQTFQLLVLGSGEYELEREMIALALAEEARERICFLQGYDPRLALKVYAAGDFFLIPSQYEPCGLTDYIAQLMGNIPIVHHVGGLVKVLDGETGFAYRRHSAEELAQTVIRALEVFETDPGRLRQMQQAAVKRIYEHHTWKQVMKAYLKLYRLALEKRYLH